MVNPCKTNGCQLLGGPLRSIPRGHIKGHSPATSDCHSGSCTPRCTGGTRSNRPAIDVPSIKWHHLSWSSGCVNEHGVYMGISSLFYCKWPSNNRRHGEYQKKVDPSTAYHHLFPPTAHKNGLEHWKILKAQNTFDPPQASRRCVSHRSRQSAVLDVFHDFSLDASQKVSWDWILLETIPNQKIQQLFWKVV